MWKQACTRRTMGGACEGVIAVAAAWRLRTDLEEQLHHTLHRAVQ